MTLSPNTQQPITSSSGTSYCYAFPRPGPDATAAQAAAAAAAARRAAAGAASTTTASSSLGGARLRSGAPNFPGSSFSPSVFAAAPAAGVPSPVPGTASGTATRVGHSNDDTVASAARSDRPTTAANAASSDNGSSSSGGFVCHVCLCPPLQRPVVTRCGHLFCWGCLDAWAAARGHRTVPCPYCKGAVDVDVDATPILGVGDDGAAATAAASASASAPPSTAGPSPRRFPSTDGAANGDNGAGTHSRTPPRAHRADGAGAPPPRPQRRPEAHVPRPRNNRWAFGAVPAFGVFSTGGFGFGGGGGVDFMSLLTIGLILYTLYTLYENWTARREQRRGRDGPAEQQQQQGGARENRFDPDMAAEVAAERQRRRLRLRHVEGLEGMFLRTLDSLGVNVDDDGAVRGILVCGAAVLFFLFIVAMSE